MSAFTAVNRELFLQRRAQGVASAKEAAKTNPHMIVVDPEDDVICDLCNNEIEDQMLWLNDYGVYCVTCRRNDEEFHASKKAVTK